MLGDWILIIYGFFGIIVLALLIYILVKRINNEKKEDFEKRDF